MVTSETPRADSRDGRRAARTKPSTINRDLRTLRATMALNKGFTAPIVMALGGWKTERMMRHYAAVTDQTLRAAAEAVAGNDISSLQPQRHAVKVSKEGIR